MDKKTSTYLVVVLVAGLGVMYMFGGFNWITGLATVGANLTVNTTCVITLNDTNITFGTVNPTAISGERLVDIKNDGNALLNATINGTNWAGPASLQVNQTKYANTSGTYASKTSVTNLSPVQFVFDLGLASSVTEYFQVQIPAGQAAGFYNQTLYVLESC